MLIWLTGQKIQIYLLSKFGDCSRYNLVQLIETVQAEVIRKMNEESCLLPVVPENTKTNFITHFRWGNFDVKKENKSGDHHITHGMAFKEKVEGKTKKRDGELSVELLGKVLKNAQREK